MAAASTRRNRIAAMVRAFFARIDAVRTPPTPDLEVERERRRGPGV